jgi:phosphatidylserine/phosphatidylglycerophosphate/cardiolipin synthase-like enzyme
MKTYRGIVRVREQEVVLDAGGVEVILDGNRDQFAPLNGLQTVIKGEQQGNVIRQATLAAQPESGQEQDPFEPVIAVINAQMARLMAIPGVFGVRPGISAGPQTPVKPVIVVVMDSDQLRRPDAVPLQLHGIPVDVRTATPLERINGLLPLSEWEGTSSESTEAAPHIGYVPPDLSEVELVEMKVRNITCHVGPDAGWTTLKPFLEGTTQSLTVAMYEFYAPHIIDTVTKLGEQTSDKLAMILQVSTNDAQMQTTLSHSWGNRLDFAKASVSGPNRVFNNSYHTKVAVRDSKAFWLSSGNWSPNSQPFIRPGWEQFLYREGNREWHVIIDDEPLAQMYEKFIRYDMRMARRAGETEAAPVMPDLLIPESLFEAEAEATVVQPHPFLPKTFSTTGPAVRVKPLMSPDNYATEILKLIQQAKHSLYLQFSYIRQPSTQVFDAIISAIAQKMTDGLDVRILVGSSQQSDHSELLIGRRGWKREQFRIQRSQLHNKGVLIDGNIAVVGSNNWSSDGTQFNRDTSLVFFSRPIAQYYTEVFLFDWNNLSRPINSGGGVTPQIAPESGPTPLGMIRIPWQAWYDE